MQRYILHRSAQGLLAVVVISMVVFALARVTGDPTQVLLPDEASEEQILATQIEWGLDKPLHIQYWIYIKRLTRGDMGNSFKWYGVPATQLIKERLPATIQLSMFALLISAGIAFPVGVMVAVKKDTGIDYAGKMFAILGQSAPPFAIGLILMWIFAVQLDWFPTSGKGGLSHMILPGVALGYYNVAALMRLTRSSMLEVLDTEYIKLARIKGVSERRVIWKHCFRNALIVPLTYFGLIGAVLITGSVVTETVFAWPGLGALVIEAILARDFTVVQAVVLLFAFTFILINIMVDILYAYIDPRIRYA